MTCNVFGGTLSLTQSINQARSDDWQLLGAVCIYQQGPWFSMACGISRSAREF